MANVRRIAAVVALTLLGSASAAYAQSAPAKPRAPAPDAFVVRGDFNLRDSQFGTGGGRRTLVWDAKKGRWGLMLDITPRGQGVDSQARDVEAGAFFRVTPQLRVGGAVGVGPQTAPARKPGDRDEETPRVRLETAFKF